MRTSGNHSDRSEAAPRLDRSGPPPSSFPGTYRFPDIRTAELGPGCRLLAIRQPSRPLVSLQLLLPAGARRERADSCGLATFAASLLDEGTANQSAPEIAARVEKLGAALEVGAGWDSTYLSLTVLSRHLRTGLELLRELLHDADFPATEIERRRRQRLTTLLQQRDHPGALAAQRLAVTLYGDRPYGRPLLGTHDSISHLDRDRIIDHHRRVHHRMPVDLIAVGDFDDDQLLTEAGAVFSATGSPDAAAPPPIQPRELDGIEVHIVDRAAAAQTEFLMGHVGLSATDPDVVPARILNSILGGKFTSRINLNLRERHGYTYGATSHFVQRRDPGPFQIAAAIDTARVGDAAREVLGELERIRDQPVSATELEDAKAYTVGSFPYSIQSIEGLASRISQIALFDLPLDHHQHLSEAVAAVDAEAVQRVAGERLRPHHLALVVVGPADRLRPQLEALGQLHIWTTAGMPLRL